MTANLPKITDMRVRCPKCGWTGKVEDTEPDDDGNLTCPECETIVEVGGD
jgi:uncharacterized Zn finger protein (UPF0148 family)